MTTPKVKRFNWNTLAMVVSQKDNGDWVRFEDMLVALEALENQKKRLREIDVALGTVGDAGLAQEVWRHAVREVNEALERIGKGGEG